MSSNIDLSFLNIEADQLQQLINAIDESLPETTSQPISRNFVFDEIPTDLALVGQQVLAPVREPAKSIVVPELVSNVIPLATGPSPPKVVANPDGVIDVPGLQFEDPFAMPAPRQPKAVQNFNAEIVPDDSSIRNPIFLSLVNLRSGLFDAIQREQLTRRLRQVLEPVLIKGFLEEVEKTGITSGNIGEWIQYFRANSFTRYEIYEAAGYVSDRHRSLVGKFLGIIRKLDRNPLMKDDEKIEKIKHARDQVKRWNQNYKFLGKALEYLIRQNEVIELLFPLSELQDDLSGTLVENIQVEALKRARKTALDAGYQRESIEDAAQRYFDNEFQTLSLDVRKFIVLNICQEKLNVSMDFGELNEPVCRAMDRYIKEIKVKKLRSAMNLRNEIQNEYIWKSNDASEYPGFRNLIDHPFVQSTWRKKANDILQNQSSIREKLFSPDLLSEWVNFVLKIDSEFFRMLGAWGKGEAVIVPGTTQAFSPTNSFKTLASYLLVCEREGFLRTFGSMFRFMMNVYSMLKKDFFDTYTDFHNVINHSLDLGLTYFTNVYEFSYQDAPAPQNDDDRAELSGIVQKIRQALQQITGVAVPSVAITNTNGNLDFSNVETAFTTWKTTVINQLGLADALQQEKISVFLGCILIGFKSIACMGQKLMVSFFQNMMEVDCYSHLQTESAVPVLTSNPYTEAKIVALTGDSAETVAQYVGSIRRENKEWSESSFIKSWHSAKNYAFDSVYTEHMLDKRLFLSYRELTAGQILVHPMVSSTYTEPIISRTVKRNLDLSTLYYYPDRLSVSISPEPANGSVLWARGLPDTQSPLYDSALKGSMYENKYQQYYPIMFSDRSDIANFTFMNRQQVLLHIPTIENQNRNFDITDFPSMWKRNPNDGSVFYTSANFLTLMSAINRFMEFYAVNGIDTDEATGQSKPIQFMESPLAKGKYFYEFSPDIDFLHSCSRTPNEVHPLYTTKKDVWQRVYEANFLLFLHNTNLFATVNAPFVNGNTLTTTFGIEYNILNPPLDPHISNFVTDGIYLHKTNKNELLAISKENRNFVYHTEKHIWSIGQDKNVRTIYDATKYATSFVSYKLDIYPRDTLDYVNTVQELGENKSKIIDLQNFNDIAGEAYMPYPKVGHAWHLELHKAKTEFVNVWWKTTGKAKKNKLSKKVQKPLEKWSGWITHVVEFDSFCQQASTVPTGITFFGEGAQDACNFAKNEASGWDIRNTNPMFLGKIPYLGVVYCMIKAIVEAYILMKDRGAEEATMLLVRLNKAQRFGMLPENVLIYILRKYFDFGLAMHEDLIDSSTQDTTLNFYKETNSNEPFDYDYIIRKSDRVWTSLDLKSEDKSNILRWVGGNAPIAPPGQPIPQNSDVAENARARNSSIRDVEKYESVDVTEPILIRPMPTDQELGRLIQYFAWHFFEEQHVVVELLNMKSQVLNSSNNNNRREEDDEDVVQPNEQQAVSGNKHDPPPLFEFLVQDEKIWTSAMHTLGAVNVKKEYYPNLNKYLFELEKRMVEFKEASSFDQFGTHHDHGIPRTLSIPLSRTPSLLADGSGNPSYSYEAFCERVRIFFGQPLWFSSVPPPPAPRNNNRKQMYQLLQVRKRLILGDPNQNPILVPIIGSIVPHPKEIEYIYSFEEEYKLAPKGYKIHRPWKDPTLLSRSQLPFSLYNKLNVIDKRRIQEAARTWVIRSVAAQYSEDSIQEAHEQYDFILSQMWKKYHQGPAKKYVSLWVFAYPTRMTLTKLFTPSHFLLLPPPAPVTKNGEELWPDGRLAESQIAVYGPGITNKQTMIRAFHRINQTIDGVIKSYDEQWERENVFAFAFWIETIYRQEIKEAYARYNPTRTAYILSVVLRSSRSEEEKRKFAVDVRDTLNKIVTYYPHLEFLKTEKVIVTSAINLPGHELTGSQRNKSPHGQRRSFQKRFNEINEYKKNLDSLLSLFRKNLESAIQPPTSEPKLIWSYDKTILTEYPIDWNGDLRTPDVYRKTNVYNTLVSRYSNNFEQINNHFLTQFCFDYGRWLLMDVFCLLFADTRDMTPATKNVVFSQIEYFSKPGFDLNSDVNNENSVPLISEYPKPAFRDPQYNSPVENLSSVAAELLEEAKLQVRLDTGYASNPTEYYKWRGNLTSVSHPQLQAQTIRYRRDVNNANKFVAEKVDGSLAAFRFSMLSVPQEIPNIVLSVDDIRDLGMQDFVDRNVAAQWKQFTFEPVSITSQSEQTTGFTPTL